MHLCHSECITFVIPNVSPLSFPNVSIGNPENSVLRMHCNEDIITPIKFKDGKVIILDQKKLPHKETYLEINSPEELIKAIVELSIRGAPLLGLAGIYGLYLASLKSKNYSEFEKYALEIKSARPTAVNLPKMVEEILKSLEIIKNSKDMKEISKIILNKARGLEEELKKESIAIAKNGAKLIEKNDAILTHCNTGSLAVSELGTALGIIKYAHNEGKNIKVYFTETRPLLQGARLTSYELLKNKIPSTLIVDSAVGYLMKEKKVNKVIVGADRIAKNGDTANKIGTYQIAVLAHLHKIPFFVAAPKSTFDEYIESGREIPIEFRDPEEVKNISEIKIAPREIEALNPAFDITPGELISAFITEEGIISS